MRYLFKYIGIFAVVLCLSLVGFLKAYFKREEIKKLKNLLSSLLKVGDMLTLGNKSRQEIINSCFKSSDIKNGHIIASWDKSGKGKSIINSFLDDFGKADTAVELSRVERTKSELDEYISAQETEYASFSKIWKTAGVCAGLAFGIMLI